MPSLDSVQTTKLISACGDDDMKKVSTKIQKNNQIRFRSVTLPTQNFMFIILDASGCYSHMNASSFTDIVFRLYAHSESQSRRDEGLAGRVLRGNRAADCTDEGWPDKTEILSFSFKDLEKRLREEAWEAGGPGETLVSLFPRAQEHFSL